jgi:uncharacterized protein (DUF3820 family)
MIIDEVFHCLRCDQHLSYTTVIKDKIPIATGGFHLKISCPDCLQYIKFVSHESPKMHFGKYRGLELSEIACRDRDYLEWLITQEIKPKLHANIIKALSGTS